MRRSWAVALAALWCLMGARQALSQPANAIDSRFRASAVLGIGLEGGGASQLVGALAADGRSGSRWWLRGSMAGWLAGGDCVTGGEGSVDTASCRSTSGWALSAGPVLQVHRGDRLAVSVGIGGGVARTDRIRPTGDAGLDLELATGPGLGVRIGAAYRRVFDGLGTGIRVVQAGILVPLSR